VIGYPYLLLIREKCRRHLVAERLDRLARSVSHLLEVIADLPAESAQSLRDPIDTSTAQGVASSVSLQPGVIWRLDLDDERCTFSDNDLSEATFAKRICEIKHQRQASAISDLRSSTSVRSRIRACQHRRSSAGASLPLSSRVKAKGQKQGPRFQLTASIQ
jgi:hypothetical protein